MRQWVFDGPGRQTQVGSASPRAWVFTERPDGSLASTQVGAGTGGGAGTWWPPEFRAAEIGGGAGRGMSGELGDHLAGAGSLEGGAIGARADERRDSMMGELFSCITPEGGLLLAVASAALGVYAASRR